MTTEFKNKRVKDKIKIEVNNVLRRLAKVRNRNKGEAIILDSPYLLTTKNLKKAGMRVNKIYVPNPYEFSKIKRKHSQTYDMLLRQFLESYKIDYGITVVILRTL